MSLKTGEQVRKALAAKGIFLTTEELDKFAKVLVNALEKSKLSEEELKNCSGGAQDNATTGAEVLAKIVPLEKVQNADGYFSSFCKQD